MYMIHDDGNRNMTTFLIEKQPDIAFPHWKEGYAGRVLNAGSNLSEVFVVLNEQIRLINETYATHDFNIVISL